MSTSLSLSPYRDMPREDLVNLSVYVPREQYEELRRTCVGHGDVPGALAFFYSILVRELTKHNITTKYEPTHREAFRTLASRVRFDRPSSSRPEQDDQRGVDRIDQETPEPPSWPA